MEPLDKKTFLSYVEFLASPFFGLGGQTSHYVALYQGGRHYDVFVKTEKKNPYITTQVPMGFLGPIDMALVDNELHPEDFFDYINQTARGFDISSVMAQLNEKVLTRTVIHKKALNFLEESLPNIDPNKAVAEFDAFAGALVGAIKQIHRDKVKASLKVIEGEGEGHEERS